MTPGERDNPKVLNGSRRSRIAKGSGTQVSEVNSMVDRFGQAQKMMSQMRRGGQMPGMPPMPGMSGPGMGGIGPGKRGATKKKGKQRSGGKSGNPAKRAQQQAGVRPDPAVRPGPAASGSAFGLGQVERGDPSALPEGFGSFLDRDSDRG